MKMVNISLYFISWTISIWFLSRHCDCYYAVEFFEKKLWCKIKLLQYHSSYLHGRLDTALEWYTGLD